ncbi:MAG: replication-associated recombination protein A [Legionellaceae bacterium]
MTQVKTNNIPLAELLRPKCLSEFVGQRHLLSQGKPLSIAFDTGKIHSMILWGPPGVGKTTLARLAAHAFDSQWIALSAVFAGVKDIREAMDLAQTYQARGLKTILFIDEIHRFNKAQQDALLPYTESGLITLIGATTENPSFELNKALLSRAQVYILESLGYEDLEQLLKQAQNKTMGHLNFDDNAKTLLINTADGDARRFLNLLEQINTFAINRNINTVSSELLQNILTAPSRRFDKSGDCFYDQISALHKSVRGSNPDAALYWFSRMMDGGADPHYIARRIIRMAWEDIGLADPRAMQIANEAASTYERLGSPEGDLALAQALIYLSVAPKSNAGYKAYHQAKAFVKKDKSRDVPVHLRNAPTDLMKKIGHGQDYRYAHDEPYGFAAQEQYFPDNMKQPDWYQPVERGLEIKIAKKMAFLKQLNQNATSDNLSIKREIKISGSS